LPAQTGGCPQGAEGLPEKTVGETVMKITLTYPADNSNLYGDTYLMGEHDEILEFETVKEAIRFLADCNFTITDLLDFDFHFEDEPEATLCVSALGGRKETWPLARRKRA
jgi:hypothetical protein